ncbi:site-specific integrase [Flavonifractor plautii]|jgi:integrase|uniref:tyrosine-type recombinase/integrase n=1 Tax=Flavonifractor plautii TaxID=292800 RepID=UPI001D035433|nr:site-specific integrase [Flavonifractor plautii]MCB5780130.1 site-specific integrase [Flavonifractor plautii]
MARRMKGEGSLYQTKDKTWVCQYYDADGKRRTKRFQRKADGRDFLDNLHQTASPQTDTRLPGQAVNHGNTVGSWMDQWLETYARPTVKLSTYCSYEMMTRVHVKPSLGDILLVKLDPVTLQEFFNQKYSNGKTTGEGGLSAKTLRNLRNLFHLALEQARKNGLIQTNLVEGVRLPKEQKREMRVLSREEQRRLMLACRAMPEPASFGVIFTLFTGLRMGEVCGLRWDNVDMERRQFLVCETRNRLPNHDDSIEASTSVCTVSTTKTDHSRRIVYLCDELYQELSRYQEIQFSIMGQYPGYNAGRYVFCQENGEPYEPRTYQDLFKRCVSRAGIPGANFHSLRHTFATRALEQGMDPVTLSKLLGHANASITLDKYGHSFESQKRAGMELMGALYAPAREPSVGPVMGF